MKSVVTHRPLRRLVDRVMRLRHSRGYGVHSPYIYSIVREVFMRRTIADGCNMDLVDDLQRCGINRRLAVELGNLYNHCGYRSYAIDPRIGAERVDFVVCSQDLSCDSINSLYKESVEHGSTMLVQRYMVDRQCAEVCREIVAHHRSTIIDRRGYLIIFNNHLPKQFFQL